MKKALTEEIAKNFALQQFNKIQNEEDRKFNILHTQAVVKTALILSKNKNLNEKDLAISSWLHDIGQTISRENHAEHSLNIAEKDFKLNEIIRDCILNHGNKKEPKTPEGKILQVADKVSVLDLNLVQLIVDYSLKKNKEEKTKDLGFIEKLFLRAITLLNNFENL